MNSLAFARLAALLRLHTRAAATRATITSTPTAMPALAPTERVLEEEGAVTAEPRAAAAGRGVGMVKAAPPTYKEEARVSTGTPVSKDSWVKYVAR